MEVEKPREKTRVKPRVNTTETTRGKVTDEETRRLQQSVPAPVSLSYFTKNVETHPISSEKFKEGSMEVTKQQPQQPQQPQQASPTTPKKEVNIVIINGFSYKDKPPPVSKNINIKNISKDRVFRTENEKCLVCSTLVDTEEKTIIRFTCGHWCCFDCVSKNKFVCPRCSVTNKGDIQLDIGEEKTVTKSEIKKVLGKQGIRREQVKELTLPQELWLRKEGFQSIPNQKQSNIRQLEGVTIDVLIEKGFTLSQLRGILFVNSIEVLLGLNLKARHLMMDKNIFIEDVSELLQYGIKREFIVSFLKYKGVKPFFIPKGTDEKVEISIIERLIRSHYDLFDIIELGWTFQDIVSDGTPLGLIGDVIRKSISPINKWSEIKEKLDIGSIQMKSFPFLLEIEKENVEKNGMKRITEKPRVEQQQQHTRIFQLPVGRGDQKVTFKVQPFPSIPMKNINPSLKSNANINNNNNNNAFINPFKIQTSPFNPK